MRNNRDKILLLNLIFKETYNLKRKIDILQPSIDNKKMVVKGIYVTIFFVIKNNNIIQVNNYQQFFLKIFQKLLKIINHHLLNLPHKNNNL